MLKDRIIASTMQLTMSEQLHNAVSSQIDTLEVSDAQAAFMPLLFP